MNHGIWLDTDRLVANSLQPKNHGVRVSVRWTALSDRSGAFEKMPAEVQEPVKSPAQMTSLAGRVAFVTGAGCGIGRAGSLAMAACGAHVIVTDRDGDLARSVADEIRSRGFAGTAREVNVNDSTLLESTIRETVKAHGRLDILHSHAGIQVEGALEQVTPDGMDASWETNVRSHFVAARAVVGQMKRQGGGSVIITASNSGIHYDREMIAYATTKHAAVAMARQMAADYAAFNIRINALCPGFVDTAFNAGFEAQMGGRAALERYITENIPMRRWATTGEIADAIVFLASDMSTFVTGHALLVDGGESI